MFFDLPTAVETGDYKGVSIDNQPMFLVNQWALFTTWGIAFLIICNGVWLDA